MTVGQKRVSGRERRLRAWLPRRAVHFSSKSSPSFFSLLGGARQRTLSGVQPALFRPLDREVVGARVALRLSNSCALLRIFGRKGRAHFTQAHSGKRSA